MIRYRYTGQPNGARYEMWREEFARRWLSVDFEPIECDRIATEQSYTEHSFLGLCLMSGDPVRILRRNDLINTARGHLYLLHASGSKLHVAQRGRSIELLPGQMALVSSDEPASVAQLSSGRRWSIRIPRKFLIDTFRNVDDMIARPIDGHSEIGELLLSQIETAHRYGPRLDAAANYAIAQHLLDLVALALGAAGDAAHLARHRGLAAARFDAIKSDILRRLGAFDLRLADIAADHRVSARYVQYLFDQAGTSFTAYVLEQRLQLAHRLLREPKEPRRKISDIATSAGFSDISYFNRAFKARYQMTPTEIRRQP